MHWVCHRVNGTAIAKRLVAVDWSLSQHLYQQQQQRLAAPAAATAKADTSKSTRKGSAAAKSEGDEDDDEDGSDGDREGQSSDADVETEDGDVKETKTPKARTHATASADVKAGRSVFIRNLPFHATETTLQVRCCCKRGHDCHSSDAYVDVCECVHRAACADSP